MSNYDHEVTLLGQTIVSDNLGNQTPVDSKNTILCEKLPVSRAEFYTAGANGMKPTLILKVHGFEYDNEAELLFDGVRYNIIKTYSPDFEEIELTCQVAMGRAGGSDEDKTG
ncbi:hypothetical protein EP56_05745 [Listeriaceae bacterium FSL A5-0209]|nr:hypothetical protein EP56_05745 [Listeriaceae bacterium FSL A5-0209]